MSRESFYFSHDYNARHDPKIKKLILKHTMTGYGIFWAIVEDLYNNANALPLDYDCIAFDLHTECEVVKSIINDFDLFVIKDGSFGSISVERRLDERNNKSESARQSAFCRWGKNKDDANAMRTQCGGNAIKERKGKKIKHINVDFSKFWNLYDKKVGDKSKCEKKWVALTDTDRQKIIDTLPLFKSSIRDKQYQPHPETYLNQKRWNDEIIVNPVVKAIVPEDAYDREGWGRKIDRDAINK